VIPRKRILKSSAAYQVIVAYSDLHSLFVAYIELHMQGHCELAFATVVA
jgi:hypothetical protein